MKPPAPIMQIVKGLIGLPSRSKRVEEGEAIVVFDSFLRERVCVCEDRNKKERKL
jgi:hypothetical protein